MPKCCTVVIIGWSVVVILGAVVAALPGQP